MSYGWPWGDWQEFTSDVNNLMNEVREKEQLSGGIFGENDVFIVINELGTSITFCHETDIQIEFNEVNPVVSQVLNDWRSKQIIHAIQKNKEDIELTYLIS